MYHVSNVANILEFCLTVNYFLAITLTTFWLKVQKFWALFDTLCFPFSATDSLVVSESTITKLNFSICHSELHHISRFVSIWKNPRIIYSLQQQQIFNYLHGNYKWRHIRLDLSLLHSRQHHLDGLVLINVFKTKFVVHPFWISMDTHKDSYFICTPS